TVGDTSRPKPDFQRAIIKAVESVTHIALADKDNKIIGADVEQHGVINYDKKSLHLCGGFTDAPYVSTTEVYPDSPNANDEICAKAQVAAITGAIEHVLSQLS
ncbi:MAG: peptidase, partial [Glaciecola sp.]